MALWIRAQWQNVVRGFWFFPGLVAAAGVVLALAVVRIDRAFGADGVGAAFGGDASAAREILGTIAGSLITVAGLAFSITVVTVQLVAGQFSPRAVRSFLGDRASQIIAGAFVGIFAYCLLVLRAVRDEEEDGTGEGFVPGLGVTVAIALGLLGLVLLLAFIHRITQLVKVENIAARIAAETSGAIEALYPRPYGEPAPRDEAEPAAWEREGEPYVMRSDRSGYVRVIALDALAEAGLPPGARVHFRVRPGDFVTRASPLLAAWPREGLDAEARDRLRELISTQSERDVAQDAAFGLRQLADLAVRALSPGVNDPTTAITCVGYLRDALELLAAREFPARLRSLGEEDVVAYVEAADFDELLREAFSEIGRFARTNARVARAALDALAGITAAATAGGARDRALQAAALADEIAAPALEEALSRRERALLEEAAARARSAAGPG